MCYVCLKPPFWWRRLPVGQYPRLCSSVCSKLADLLMGNTSLQPEPEIPVANATRKLPVLIRLCGTTPIDVVLAEYYVEELWAALDQTLQHSGCGVGSDTPVAQGGTLNPTTFKIVVPQHR